MILKLALLAAFVLGCNSQKDASSFEVATDECPPDGTCSITVLKNKQIVIPQKVVGSTYYKLTESADTDVVRYQYVKVVDTSLSDSAHREELVFEISASDPSAELAGNDLQKTRMVFGRYCFCRGSTGVYSVRQGKLSVKMQGSALSITTRFTINEVPQTITGFTAIIK